MHIGGSVERIDSFSGVTTPNGYQHTYLGLFAEGARLALPWPLTSSNLNTASVYYLLDLSSFSLLFSPLFLYYLRFLIFFFSLFPRFCLFRLCLYVKPAANN